MRFFRFLLYLLALSLGPLYGDFGAIRDCIRRGDFVAALPACDRELKANPRDYQIWTLKGIALQSLGRSGESLEAFRRALALSPKFLPALEGAAQIEYQEHDPHCRETLQKILAASPDTPTAHAMLGVLAFEGKDCASAVRHYEKAGDAALDPVARWQLATCYFRLERWDGAETQFRKLLRLRDNDEIRYNLALVQWKARRPADAIATLEPIARTAAPDADAMSLLAAAYESNKEAPEALSALRRALEIHPGDETLYIDLGAFCLEHNAIPLGIEVLEVGAGNVPQSARIRAMLGILEARGGFTEKAEAAFQSAERMAPDASLGSVGLAVTLMHLNAADSAADMLRARLPRHPDDVPILTTLAQAILQIGTSAADLNEARQLLEKAVRLERGNGRARSLLGKLYMQLDDIAKAVPILESAIRLDPTDRMATYQLMLAYRRQGRTREASRLQEKVRILLEAERDEEAEAGRFQLVRSPERPPRQ
jgi:Flp pilus assembly protein TadD